MSENKYKQLRAETDLDRLRYGHIKFTYVYPMKKGDSKFANMCREVKSVKKDLTDLEAKQNLQKGTSKGFLNRTSKKEKFSNKFKYPQKCLATE